MTGSRVLALAFVVFGALACGHKDNAQGDPTARAGSDDLAGEQQKFDAERRPDQVVTAMGIGPGSRVADIGAGSGLLTVHLARAVAPDGRVVATDIDQGVLDLLGKRMTAMGFGQVVQPKLVSADAPGLEDHAYDAILLAEVDHYFQDPVAWLKAATAALKPGGRIVISNRIYHRAQSMEAARKAGLVLKSESEPVPTHFVAVFTAPET
ncbi:MAG TPA: class I SAM-dependent methyltransferase [Kofleriaceae bacterium]|nr:class I SAM-dependent methyltransferase [Kofleriaceae bacterium]